MIKIKYTFYDNPSMKVDMVNSIEFNTGNNISKLKAILWQIAKDSGFVFDDGEFIVEVNGKEVERYKF